MILADENIYQSIIHNLRAEGIDVLSIYETTRGLSDFEIAKLSRNPPRIILTEDKDFADMVFAFQIKDISVILLRYKFDETLRIIEILIDLLKNPNINLFGKFTTITTKRIRIKEII
jgi:predicted nuclease of predicted toxin-antitoxin system